MHPQPKLKLKATEYTEVLPVRPFSTAQLNVFLVFQLITTELTVPHPSDNTCIEDKLNKSISTPSIRCLVHGLVVFSIFISLLMDWTGLDDVQEGEEMVLALPPDLLPPDRYIVVQVTAHDSVSGLPVLITLYKLIPIHKRTTSLNCEFCVFFFFYIFLTFGQFNQKSGIFGEKLN